MKTTNLITGKQQAGKIWNGIPKWFATMIVSLLFIVGNSANAQDLELRMDTVDACPGDQILVGLYAKNLTDLVGSISLTYIYDPAVVTPVFNTANPYVFLSNVYPNFFNGLFPLTNAYTHFSGSEVFTVGAFGIPIPGSYDTINGKLFDMKFNYHGGEVNLTPLSVAGGENEISYISGTPTQVWYNGKVIESGTIQDQPTDQNVNEGDPAVFTLSALNATGYQWQENTGSGWSSLSNNSPYSGVSTATLTINPTVLSMNGYQYRCIVTGPCVKNSFTSDTATLGISSSCNDAVANLPASVAMCSSDGSINLSGSALDYDSVLWTTSGDGTFVNETTLNPTYTPGAGDLSSFSATITLTAYAAPPCNNGVDNMSLTIWPEVTGDAGSDESTCQGVSFSLNNSTTQPSASALNGGTVWTHNGTGSITNANTLTPTYNPGAGETGDVELVLTVNGISPCPNVTDTMTLTITPGPIVDAGSDETICAGQPFDLANSATPPSSGGIIDSLRWTAVGTGTLTGATTITPTYTPGAGETGFVTLILTGYGGGCPEAIDFMNLNIVEAPTAAISGDTALCPGESTDIEVSFSGSAPWTFTYSIDGSDQTPITTSTNPYIINVSPGSTTTYGLSAVENASCPGTVSGSATVTINTLPTVTATATPASLCQGESTTLSASGASTYVWDNGLGAGNNLTATPISSTTYNVTGTDVNGCNNTASVSVTVNAVPNVTASASADTICEGESTDLTASGANSYAWSSGDNTATATVSPTANTTYTVTGTSNGCTATASVAVVVNPNPVVAVTATADTICEGESSQLTASGADTYLWSTTETTAGITVSPLSTATYTVTGTTNGCTGTAEAEVVVNALPVADADTNQDINTNTSTTLSGSATGGSGDYSYSWSPAGSLVDPNVQNPVTTNLMNTTVFTLVVTDNITGCVSLPSTMTVNVTGAALSANATATPSTICLGDTTFLAANAAGGSGTYTYSWTSMPAGFTSSLADPFDLPAVTTTYYVEVNDGAKTVVEDSVTVTVNPLPSLTLTATDDTLCEGENTDLTVTGADTYTWSTSESGSMINVAPFTTTTFSVTGTSAAGCTATASIEIVVNPLPLVAITTPDDMICLGESTDLTASGADSYVWSTTETSSTITVSPTVTTTYEVTGTDAEGCVNIAYQTVDVMALPTVMASAADDTICEGESSVLTASGADTYEWSSTETTAIITVTPATTSTYSVTGTDSNGCVNTADVTVTVNALPVVDATAADDTICAGESTLLTASGADSYAWSTTETTAQITVTPASDMTYTVTGTDVNGCTNTASVDVVVNDLPVVSISATFDTICEGESTDLTASGADTYEWNGGETTAMINVSPATTSTYTVTGTDINGCTNTATFTVVVNPLPTVTASAAPATICAGESTDLTASGADTYLWSNSATTATLNITPAATTTYSVTGTDINGCTNTAEVTVTVNDLPVASAGIDQLIPYNSSTTLSGSATAGSGNYSYAWSPASELVDANVQNPTTVALTSTTVFTLIVTDVTTGCVGPAATVTINVSGAPLILSVNATPDVICEGESSQLLATATGGSGTYTYSWTSSPAGFTSSINNPVVSPIVTTTYYVSVDDGAKTVLNDSVTVTVNAAPTAYAGMDTAICEGETVTIVGATAANQTGVNWAHNGLGTLSGAGTLTPTYSPASGETGTVTLTLTAGATAPCTDATDQVDITINALPLINTQPIDASVVEPNGTSFSVAATGAVSYQWQLSTDGGTTWNDLADDTLYSGSMTSTLTLASSALPMNGYQYQCIVEANGCEVTSNAATLSVSASGASIVTTAASLTACPGDTVIVPIDVEDFIDVASASLVLEFDPAVLSFLNVQNLNATMAGITPFLVNSTANSVILSWFSVTPANIGTTTLAEFVFEYAGGMSVLNWDLATAGNCEYSDLGGLVLPATFVNGQVSQANTAAVITAQPTDQNILDGDNATFSLTATGADTYQWQVRIGGGAWTDLGDSLIYSGTSTSMLTLTGATLLENFYEFRCILTETTCNLTTTSDIATLYVDPAGPVITTAGNVTACPGNTVLVPVNVEDMSTTSSISLTLGFDPAVLNYVGLQNINAALNSAVPLINASSGSFLFSWFSIAPASIANDKLFDIEFTYIGGTTALSWDTVTSGNCEYTDFNAIVLPDEYTDGSVGPQSAAPVITTPPAAVNVTDGDTATFTVAATGASTYQWQISTNGGGSWSDLTDNATYQGSSTASLNVNGADLLMNFDLFRCIVTESVCGLTATSAAAELTVDPAGPVITTAGDVSGCPGASVMVPVTVENMSAVSSISLTLGYDPAVLTYVGISNVNAQLASAVPTAFAASGSFGFSWFSIAPAFISNDILFEIEFTYNGGYTDLEWDTLSSGACEYGDVNALILPDEYFNGSVGSAASAPAISVNPADQTVFTQDAANFSVTATGADTYQWQESTDGGSSWNDLTDGGIYSGTATSSLSLSLVNLGMNGNQYRCILAENLCGLESTSTAGTLNVNPIQATTSVGSDLACVGDTVVIPVDVVDLYDVASISLTLDFDPAVLNFVGSQNVNAALSAATPLVNASAGSVKFSWFWVAPTNVGTGTLFDLVFVYQGGSTNLTWDLLTSGNTEYGDINTNDIPSTYTNGSVGFAGVAATITSQPGDTISYDGFDAAFSVTATGATAYQWQVSTNGGASWTDLTASALYSGVNTNDLQLTSLSVAMDGYQYRCVVTGTCDVTTNSDAGTLTVMAQPPIQTYATHEAACLGTVVVPVVVEDFNNVSTISLGLEFDGSMLNYLNYQNVHPALTGSYFLINVAGNEIFVSWYSFAPAFIGNDTLFELVFDGLVPGTSALEWDLASPGVCQYTDAASTILLADYYDGSVTIYPNPQPSISGSAAVCEGASSSYSTAAMSGHSYQWTVTGGVIASGQNTNQISVNWGTAGAGTVSLFETIDSSGCFASATPLNVTINSLPAPTVSGADSVCEMDMGVSYTTALNAGSSYTWTVNGGSIVGGQNTNSILVDWGNAGAANVSVTETVTATGCSATSTFNVTVNALPMPSISGMDSVCENTSGVTYSTADVTGHSYNWTVTGGTLVSGQGTHSISVDWGMAGTGTIDLTETNDASGCFATAGFTVTINTLPQPMITGPDAVCETSAGNVYSTAATAGNSYAWTISGGTIVSGQNTSSITVDWGSAGTGTLGVTETVDATGCAGSASYSVQINPLPAPAITGPDSVCEQFTGASYSTADVSGNTYVWTISGGTITSGQNTHSIMVDWGSAGTGTLELTETVAATGCSVTTTFNVVISELPMPLISGTDSVCENTASVVYSTPANAGHSYNWTVTGGTIASGQGTSSITIDWGAAGTFSIDVMESIDATGCQSSASFSVVVSPLPAAMISGMDSVCENESGVTYSTTATTGNSYNWIVSGGTITSGQNSAAITVDWGTAGTGTVSLTETVDATGCSTTSTLNVTISPLPVPMITGQDSLCENVTGIVYSTADVSGHSYAWTITGGVITSGQNTHSITVDWGAAGAGSLMVTETDDMSGCNASASMNITLNALPQPMISGADSVCENESGLVYSTPDVAGNSYNWTITGGTITAGQGTQSVTVDWDSAGTGTLTVTETVVATSCASTATYDVTISILPAPMISGINTVCEFYTGAVYSVPANAGSSYQWTVTGGTITAGQGTDSITVDWGTAGAATVSVTETTVNGCQATGNYNVTINVLPSPVITGADSVCEFGNAETYFTAHSPGNVYSWTVVGGTIVQGAGSSSIDVEWNGAGTGTIDLNVTTAEGCSADATTFTVAISPLPEIFNITGGGSFCAGTSGVAVGLDSSASGISYELYVDGLATGQIVQGTGTAISFGNQTAAGSYSVIAGDMATGCQELMNGAAIVTVLPAPSIVTQPANVYVDEGNDALFTVVANNATSYQWQISLNNGGSWTSIGNGASFSGVTTDSLRVLNTDLSMSGQMFRVLISGDCQPDATSNGATLTVNPIITTTIGDIAGCAGNFVVPVNVEHFIGVASISLTLDIDTSQFQFNGYQNLNPALSSGSPLINLLGDQVKFSYFTLFPVTIGDGILLELLFSSDGGYTDLSWDVAVAGNCEYNAVTGLAYTGIFVDGSLEAYPLPGVFNVTGGGSFCNGGTGVSVGLDGSETGIEYTLYLDGTTTATSLMGTGNALDFGLQTAGGNYTVYATDTATQCSEWMTASANIVVLASPASFNVTGGGSICTGEPGLNVGLDGSEMNVSYELYVDGLASGSILPGTGNALDFGTFTTAGTYTVMATHDTSACTSMMNGNAVIIVNPLPMIYNVTGGGSFCDNGTGVDVSLDGSEMGVEYTLYIDGSASAQSLMGTGSGISFGMQNLTGVYTVYAMDTNTGCAQFMNDSAVINLYPNPQAFNVSGGGTLCAGGSGYTIDLDSSEMNVNYELYLNGTATGQIEAGTGSALSFPAQTAAGTYTVMATETTNGCSVMMNGSALIIVNPNPVVFNVTGGGPYCDGSNGSAVGLDGSQAGIAYELYLDGTATGIMVYGTGSALDFGMQTATGTYTVMAMDTVTACTSTMNGVVDVSVSPLPTADAGGFAIICAGESTVLGGSASGGTPPYTYSWTPATGLSDPSIANPVASPATTTYYVLEVMDSIGCTATDTALVVVNPTPVVDAGLDKAIYLGTPTLLNGSVSGGAAPYSYHWTPGGSLDDSTALTPVATPTATTTYTLMVTDANGCVGQDAVTITVNPTPPGYNMFGKVTYDNSVQTALTNVDVYLEDGSSYFDTTMTDALGNYIFTGLANATFQSSASTAKAWGGVNALDALLIAQQFQGTANLTGLKLGAADVDGNGVPNANDAFLTLQRAAGALPSFPIMEDWLFEEKTVTVAGADVINNFMGICYGDVNGSYLPGSKSASLLAIDQKGSMDATTGSTVSIPVYAAESFEAAALSLEMEVPAGMEIISAQMASGQGTYVEYSAGRTVNLEWYNLETASWNEGEAIMYITVSISQEYTGASLMLSTHSLAGDIQGNALAAPRMYSPKLNVSDVAPAYSLGVNYPNPFNTTTEIRFSIPEAADVRLSVFNMLGEEILVLTDEMFEAGEYQVTVNGNELVPGTYFYRMVANGETREFSQTHKMIVTR